MTIEYMESAEKPKKPGDPGLEDHPERNVSCMLVRVDKDKKVDLCYNNAIQYANEYGLLQGGIVQDDMWYSAWSEGNRIIKSVETGYIDPDYNYAFLVLNDITSFDYKELEKANPYVLFDTGVKVKLYMNDKLLFEKMVPEKEGFVWEPFYIRGINGGVYTLDDMYKKVHYAIGGGDYYEE